MSGDDAAHARTVGIDHLVEPALDLSDGDHPHFAIVGPVIDEIDRPAFEREGRCPRARFGGTNSILLRKANDEVERPAPVYSAAAIRSGLLGCVVQLA